MSSRTKRMQIPTEDPDSENEGNMIQLEKKQTQITRIDSEERSKFIDQMPQIPPIKHKYYVSKLLLFLFPLLGVMAIGCTLLMYFGVIPDYNLILMCIMTGTGLIVSVIAMYGSYRYGELEEAMDSYQQQNEKYGENAVELKQRCESLKETTKGLQQNVDNLNEETVELKQSVEAFDELREALQEIANEDEEILQYIDDLNEQYNDMKILALKKDEAHLLLLYYNVMFGGKNKNAFGRNDYGRFIGRLNEETKRLYDNFGGFEALDIDKNGHVDAQEFMIVTAKVLENTQQTFENLSRQKTLKCRPNEFN